MSDNTGNPTESSTLLSDANDPKALKALLDFSVNNSDLDKLEALTSKFNPFKILGITDFEIRHSRVLAWLIDPAGHHGLGDRLFKGILLEVLRESINGGLWNDVVDNELPSITEVISADFTDLNVLREWRNIDIFAVSPSNRIAVVIENKWNAAESEHQLTKYAKTIDNKYEGYKKVFVFLTLDGVNPVGSERYIPFRHEQIYSIVKSVVELRKGYMHTKVYDFIQQYLEILEDATMQNEEFINMCSKLYREHKDAISMIMKYGRPMLEPNNIKKFHAETDTQGFQKDITAISQSYGFIPRAWSNIVPEAIKKSHGYVVSFWLEFHNFENHEVSLVLYVSDFENPDERHQFMDMLDEANKNGISKIKTANKNRKSIYGKIISLEDDTSGKLGLDEYDAITEMLINVYNRDKDVRDVFEVVDKVVKKFWRESL